MLVSGSVALSSLSPKNAPPHLPFSERTASQRTAAIHPIDDMHQSPRCNLGSTKISGGLKPCCQIFQAKPPLSQKLKKVRVE